MTKYLILRERLYIMLLLIKRHYCFLFGSVDRKTHKEIFTNRLRILQLCKHAVAKGCFGPEHSGHVPTTVNKNSYTCTFLHRRAFVEEST